MNAIRICLLLALLGHHAWGGEKLSLTEISWMKGKDETIFNQEDQQTQIEKNIDKIKGEYKQEKITLTSKMFDLEDIIDKLTKEKIKYIEDIHKDAKDYSQLEKDDIAFFTETIKPYKNELEKLRKNYSTLGTNMAKDIDDARSNQKFNPLSTLLREFSEWGETLKSCGNDCGKICMEVLGFPKGTFTSSKTPLEIKKRYRSLAMMFHPDKTAENKSTYAIIFTAIGSAYAKLKELVDGL